jgi:hypothetical protein
LVTERTNTNEIVKKDNFESKKMSFFDKKAYVSDLTVETPITLFLENLRGIFHYSILNMINTKKPFIYFFKSM